MWSHEDMILIGNSYQRVVLPNAYHISLLRDRPAIVTYFNLGVHSKFVTMHNATSKGNSHFSMSSEVREHMLHTIEKRRDGLDHVGRGCNAILQTCIPNF